ncbi:capsule biosynthesis GfcC family protein [Pseudidiomarina sp. 1ASP75-14]|uniref:capsule biosynthesis GfcC D2 domain-containing protein n=1 Tax=Pseudidiomarina terrestris TaxID=2820060 RepID=UPI00264B3ADF|nr:MULTISPECIES: capsule biosynthesis GfcC D2 domain-containing protein [unclassified Pseudidiomarina]MDN7126987.1 capsule biosynthesis GfcC family protein [Pseudidiomarina sp. 1APR75-33.1]MDN7136828.1 capsule biosynthesis GfcC family protein [Pseudidiomarina sp. 1ASP75-14]
MMVRRCYQFACHLVTFLVLGFGGLGVGLAQEQAATGAAPVTVTVGNQVYAFSERPRLLKIYQAAELAPAAYWASTRLLSVRQTEQLKQRRQHVLQRLERLTQIATASGELELAQAAQAYAEQIHQWPLVGAEWIGLTKIDDSLEVQSGVDVERKSLFSSFSAAASDMDANPLLPAGDYQLLPPKALGPWQVTLISADGVQQLQFTEQDTVRSILKRGDVFRQDYNLTEVELIAITGLSARTKVAYYNDAKALPPVHGLIFVPLDLSSLDNEWQNLNQQISALARYWNPQS